jgi:hypothetical protein
MDDRHIERIEFEMESVKELLHGLSAQLTSLAPKKKKKESSSSKISKHKGAMG